MQERIELTFVGKINVPQSQRGSTQSIPGHKWLVQAAHQWGVHYLKALGEALEAGLNRTDDGVAPLPLPVRATTPVVRLVEDTAKRRAYMRGYMAWYLCGRPKEPNEPGYAPGQMFEWFEYTVTEDNPEGSSRADFVKSPSDHCTMELWAERAFYRYAEEEAVYSTSSALSAAILAASSSTAAGSSSSSAGKRPMVGEESASPSRPRLDEPAPPLSTQAFMKAFMDEPNARHAWRPGPFKKIQRRVAEAQQQNLIIGVASEGPGPGVIRELELPQIDSEQTPGMHIYTRLKETYKIDETYDAEHKKLKSPEEWPDAFKELELERVGEGGYNTVWRVKENASGVALNALLPKPVADALIKRECVLRMPKPSNWTQSSNVALEMCNMMDAALSGFGPSVVAMWCGHTVESTPGDGRTKAWFKLFVVMERGTMSVFDRLQDAKKNPMTDAQWKIYLYSMQRCIWWMSANRCVYLDSKPSNFVDIYPGAVPSKHPDAKLRIKAIDLDSSFYGRIEPLTTAEATDANMQPTDAMGWKPCWLYNVLVMSCNLRMYLKDDIYQKHWWSKIKNAVKQVELTVLRNKSPYPNDAEYDRALRFLKHANAEWKGDFYWKTEAQGAPSGCKVSETLALIAVNQTKHYYHDEWWRQAQKRLVVPAEEMVRAIGAANVAQRDGSTLAEQERLKGERDQKMNECRHAWRWYDEEFRSTAVPMIRFFEDQLAVPRINVTQPKQLWVVLKAYADMTKEDLAPYAYPPGRPPWRHPAQLRDGPDWAIHNRWLRKPAERYHHGWVSEVNWSEVQGLAGPQREWASSPYWSALQALGFGDLVAPGAQKTNP